MELDKRFDRVGGWLEGSGPAGDIVISSRVRLARNVAGFQFYSQAQPEEQAAVLAFVREKLMASELKDRLWFVEMDQSSSLERRLLAERHLISRELAEAGANRAVAIAHDESLALMINEEDHLRIQMMSSGLQVRQTYQSVCAVDDLLEQVIDYAFSPEYGYLTACPTNVGTGMRVSVMLHLPGLKMAGQIEKVFRAAKELRLAIRGLYGEGSEPIGDFFQLSNQITLGKSEEEIIIELVERAVEPILEYERRARQKLIEEKPVELDDKIFRARGVLASARLISSEETLYMLSYIRLGIHLKRITDISLDKVNRLFLLAQPGHLQNICKEKLDANKRDRARADFLRKELLNGKA